MRKLFQILGFFVIAPLFILFNIAFLAFFAHLTSSEIAKKSQNEAVSYAALPTTQNISSGIIDQKDMRVEIVSQFLKRYSSPLEPFAQDIISKADFYGIDFRFLPAIAMQESNLCKKAPANSYNCWGFGIYGKKVTQFKDYPQAIDVVSKTLARDYIAYGLQTPQEIMKKYTPSNNGSWADSVNHFMNQLQFIL